VEIESDAQKSEEEAAKDLIQRQVSNQSASQPSHSKNEQGSRMKNMKNKNENWKLREHLARFREHSARFRR
jgi:hypothetical protein